MEVEDSDPWPEFEVKDIDGAALALTALAELRRIDSKRLPAIKGKPRLGPCIAMPSKFIAIGLNYIDHARETGAPHDSHELDPQQGRRSALRPPTKPPSQRR